MLEALAANDKCAGYHTGWLPALDCPVGRLSKEGSAGAVLTWTGTARRCTPYRSWLLRVPIPSRAGTKAVGWRLRPLGRDTNAKTSPAPSAAVLITRSCRAEQASKKLQESPKVRAEPGEKSITIYIYIQGTSVPLSLPRSGRTLCLCWAAQCGPRQRDRRPAHYELRGRRPLQPQSQTRNSPTLSSPP